MLKSIQAHEQILKNHLQFIIATLFCLIIWLYPMTLFSLRELLAGQKNNSLPILFSVFGGRVDTIRTEYLRIKFTT